MTRPPPSARLCRPRGLLVLAALLAVAGCASTAPVGLDRDQLARLAAARGLEPSRVVLPYELDDAMGRWARETASAKVPPATRLELLRERLLEDDALGLEYVWNHTGTALEVFRERRANCLAFTFLFVGMAREVEVPVYFLAVENVETYRKEGDLVVISDHVAVGFDLQSETLVYDFSEHGSQEPEDVRRISDLTAISMFHSNRGAEALQAGRVEEAVGWLRAAVVLDPELAHGWSNLGVGLRRVGDTAGAEEAYRKALEIDPRIPSAYLNLASLLRLLARDGEAAELEAALRASPSRNPYTYLVLGDISRRGGRLAEARRFYRRAASLARRDAEPYAALGQLALDEGDLRRARKMLRKARRIDDSEDRTSQLAARLAEVPELGS